MYRYATEGFILDRRLFFFKSIFAIAAMSMAREVSKPLTTPTLNSVTTHEYESFHKYSENKPHIVKRFFTSKKYPDKLYTSVDEFWSDNKEPEGVRVNNILFRNNELLKTKSFLMKDRKTVISFKVYRNKNSHAKFKRYLKIREEDSPFNVINIS